MGPSQPQGEPGQGPALPSQGVQPGQGPVCVARAKVQPHWLYRPPRCSQSQGVRVPVARATCGAACAHAGPRAACIIFWLPSAPILGRSRGRECCSLRTRERALSPPAQQVCEVQWGAAGLRSRHMWATCGPVSRANDSLRVCDFVFGVCAVDAPGVSCFEIPQSAIGVAIGC